MSSNSSTGFFYPRIYVGFIEESTAVGLPYLTLRHVRPVGLYSFFFSHRFSPHLSHSFFFVLFWGYIWDLGSFVRVIRDSRAAICHTHIQKFAPQITGNESKKKGRAFSYQYFGMHVRYLIFVCYPRYSADCKFLLMLEIRRSVSEINTIRAFNYSPDLCTVTYVQICIGWHRELGLILNLSKISKYRYNKTKVPKALRLKWYKIWKDLQNI